MPRPAGSLRLASSIYGLSRAGLPCSGRRSGLLLGLLLAAVGSLLAPSATNAADPAPAADVAESGSDGGSTRWGPIVGACVGVIFGGALAVWQIRGMKRDR